MGNIVVPNPAGSEVVLFNKKFKNFFYQDQVEGLVSFVSGRLERFCQGLIASEDIALINYNFSMRELKQGVVVCHAEGGCFLSVGSPPRVALVQSFHEYCVRNLWGSIEELSDRCLEPYVLDCYFFLSGYRDSISVDVDVFVPPYC